MRTRTSWREKLNDGRHTKVCPIPEGMQKRFGLGTMLIPKPLDVDALIRQVPKGRLITTGQIRAALASAAGASVTCPLVTGIAIRIAAEVEARTSSPRRGCARGRLLALAETGCRMR